MKRATLIIIGLVVLFLATSAESCDDNSQASKNVTASQEQDHTEKNQAHLNQVQPPPNIDWSLERDNLIKRFKLQNDKTVSFYLYVFVEGVGQPIGYYLVNKVSSVNSQLTNPSQIVRSGGTVDHFSYDVVPSPAEDGSYGTNGDGVFGFTPEQIYLETNMHYVVSTVPLHFAQPVYNLAVVDTPEGTAALERSKTAMNK